MKSRLKGSESGIAGRSPRRAWWNLYGTGEKKKQMGKATWKSIFKKMILINLKNGLESVKVQVRFCPVLPGIIWGYSVV